MAGAPQDAGHLSFAAAAVHCTKSATTCCSAVCCKFEHNMCAGTQAITAAPDIAKQYSQQIVETEHLLKVLLEQPNGLARKIVSKAEGNPTALLDATEAFIRRQPRVSGDSSQVCCAVSAPFAVFCCLAWGRLPDIACFAAYAVAQAGVQSPTC